MENSISTLIQACQWFPSNFLIFSQNVYQPFVYYSYFGSAIPALFIGIFIYLKNKKDLSSRLLFCSILSFCIWIFCNFVLWATEFPSYTMFFWALINLFEPFVYFFAFYFVYTFLFKKDLNLKNKILSVIPMLPIILLTPTKWAILGFNLSNCDRAAVEGITAFYGYGIEILYTLLILIVFFISHRKKDMDPEEKKRNTLLVLAVIFFLVSLSLGNILESVTDNWYIGQAGLLGVPIFVGLLSFIMVRFKAFNAKFISIWIFVISL